MPYFYFDYTYLLLLPALIFALWAQARVQSSYNKYNKVMTRSGMTGADAARMILDANGLTNVRIEQIAGNLTDHFDPKANVIRLSNAVYGSRGVAALGVAAHEAGHAVQYAENYSPMRLRASIIGITNIGSRLALPIFLIGLLFSYELALIGIALFSLTAVFQAVTLPVEFNASSRALEMVEQYGILGNEEVGHTKKVLSAAAMTYVAAAAASILQLLRLVLLFGRRSRD